MPSANLFGGAIPVLEKALELRSLRHNVLAANIANMDTPNYKAFEVHVEEALKAQRGEPGRLPLARTRQGHLPGTGARPVAPLVTQAAPPEFSLRADGNTVDVDRTMGRMAENTLQYKTAAQLISQKFKGLRQAIQGGK